MKKFFLTCVLFIAAFGTCNAQLPEFSLHVKLFVNGDSAKTVIFGYDPAASDSMLYRKETWFSNEFPGGEQLYPPGQIGDLDFRMSGFYVNRPELGINGADGGPIDIRKKPARDTFSLNYGLECHVVPGTTNARMEWDPQKIPAIIKHITVASSFFPHIIRLDMKSVPSFVFPLADSGEDLYSNMILTLYYNKEIDISGVSSGKGFSPEDLTLYPNPMDAHSKLHFVSTQDSRMTLSAYDITGKKVLERSLDAHSGENTLDLGRDDLSSHSGVYLIRLRDGRLFEKSITIIVR